MKKTLQVIPLVLLVAVCGIWFYARQQVKSVIDQRIEELMANGDYQALDYESLALELNGDFHITNLHVVDAIGNEFILEEIHITEYDFSNEFPHHMTLTASGIRLPAGMPQFGNSANQSLNTYLDRIMDEDFLPLSLNYHFEYMPDTVPQMDATFGINLPGSFNLTTDSVMRNISLEEFKTRPQVATNPLQYSMLLQQAAVPSASMTLQDLGIVDAMMAIQGESLSMSADDYRQQFLAQLQTMVLFAPRQLQPTAQRFLNSFANFMAGGKTLQVSLTPEFGGDIQQLQAEIMGAFYIGNFARIEELLNIEITTN